MCQIKMISRREIRWLNTVYLVGAFVVLLSLVYSLEADSRIRKPQGITPITDNSKTKNKGIMVPEFANAGQKGGLEIWRIEDFKPKPYPKNDYGKFYTGDSYIILNTKEKNNMKSWDIHFWLGSETTQDESGSAAILSVYLDDQLGGVPIQYREVQDHESQAFLSLFKSGVRYMPGGIASGFTHVDRNKHEKRMYQIKGKKNIRVKQVDLTVASMNKGDCFILDIGSDVFVYLGTDSQRSERIKAINAANQIRDQDHGGRATITIIDEFSPESDFVAFFEALGDGSVDTVPEASAGGDDEDFEITQEKIVSLYRVSDASGSIKVELISGKPLHQSMLDTNDCFILDTQVSNLYIWVGKKCTKNEKVQAMNKAQAFLKEKNYPNWTQVQRDESGAAAILAVQLDDQLGGVPIQYREVQDHESQAFLSLFKSGVRYVPGGIASGFTHVDRNNHEKRMYQIKGKRNIRVKQVDLTVASMNKGDCFILDIGSDVYVYVGTKAKKAERLKAVSAANQIRDQDHGGRAKVSIIDEFSPKSDFDTFFAALGGGSADAVPDETAGGDDEAFEKTQEKIVSLYRISDASGSVKVDLVSGKPLLQSMLDTNDCFILDTQDSNLYIWVGKKCTSNEKSQAMNKAQAFLKEKKYPAWTQVQRIVEGAEPASFRQYFKTWKGQNESHTRLIRSTQAKPKPKIELKNQGEAPEFMPDDGSGDVEIWRIENFEMEPINPETYGKFFGGDSYVIKYSHKNNYIIYIWQGDKSTNDEKAASAMHAVTLDNVELGGKAIQIRVVQGYEPKHFLHIFKGKLITFIGGKASGFKNLKDHETYVKGETRVFRVRGTNEFNVRANQLPAVAKSLASDDAFIVDNDENTWIWMGKGADPIERDLADDFAKLIVPDATLTIIEEGKEPQEFWDSLGGEDSYVKNYEEEISSSAEPRLFHCILKNGNIKMEEINNFDQGDLIEDDVMILDNNNELFVWIGKDADDDEKKSSITLAHKYLEKNGRRSTIVLVVKQGEEPSAFKSLFDKWEGKMSFTDIRARFQ